MQFPLNRVVPRKRLDANQYIVNKLTERTVTDMQFNGIFVVDRIPQKYSLFSHRQPCGCGGGLRGV